MNNLLSIQILERLEGRKLPAILGERTGVSERTWRHRSKQGWEPKPHEINRIIEKSVVYTIDSIQAKGGWDENEARKIIEECPSQRAGISLPTADLIYFFRPGYGGDYADSIAVASQFDRYCHILSNAKDDRDIDGARKILVDCLEWVLSYSHDADAIDAELQILREELLSTEGLDNLLKASKPLSGHLYFLVLSCWDLEFCSQYFGEKAMPYPLFKLVMPRLSPKVKLDQNSNRYMRNGKPIKRGLFQKSMSRLLDFIAVLISWHKERRPPEDIPTVKEMVALFNEDHLRITSWRDETTHFTCSQLFSIWDYVFDSAEAKDFPSVPAPMLVAAHLFSPLLTTPIMGNQQLLDCSDDYERWWNRNLDRLIAKGLKFGTAPWPKCLTG